MKNYAIIKSKSGKLTKVAATMLGVVSLASCSTKDLSNMATSMLYGINPNEYSSLEQVEDISQALDVSLDVFKFNDNKNCKRLKHNEGEPIYISLSQDVEREHGEYVQKSLDQVFGAVSAVNDNYKYEIVDANTLSSHRDSGKTCISYSFGDCNENRDMYELSRAYCASQIKSVDKDIGWLISNADIKFDFEDFQKNIDKMSDSEIDAEIEYIYTHELFHAFGFDDVYTMGKDKKTDVFMGNTLMNSAWSTQTKMTPNDYGCLLSNYAKPMTENEMSEYISRAKEKLDEYSDFYLDYFIGEASKKGNIDNSIGFKKGQNYKYTSQRGRVDLDGSEIVENYQVSINNDGYMIVITDKDGNVLEQTSGKAYYSEDGAILLQNTTFKTDIRPLVNDDNHNGFIANLVMINGENGARLYNVFDNDQFILREAQKNIEMNR